MTFTRITEAPWIDEAASLLPFELPRCFSEFIRHYTFCDFQIHRLHHYDNFADNFDWCWHVAITRDQSIFEFCKRHLFLPIGQPDDGNYDRLCLDLNRLKNGDCPVVQLDHESILLKNKLKIVGEPFPSYEKLTTKVLDAYFQGD